MLETSKDILVKNERGRGRLFNHLFILENVSVVYPNGYRALDGITFTMQNREILFVTGASGAGKSTLLRVLQGELAPTSGSFDFNPGGSDFFVATVSQELDLLPRKSCEYHLWTAYDKQIHRSEAAFRKELMDLVTYFGIQDRLGLKMTQANGGLKQKVAIIRALLSRPDLFIADEPTSSLDTNNAQKLFEVLELYNRKRNMAVVWASHNRELVRQFTGRIIHLDRGHLVHSGHACFI